jgi:hypothetical protein
MTHLMTQKRCVVMTGALKEKAMTQKLRHSRLLHDALMTQPFACVIKLFPPRAPMPP